MSYAPPVPACAPAPPTTVPASLGYLSAAQLAVIFGVAAEPLRKQLERWRARNGDGWVEVANPRRGEPRYLFDARLAWHMLLGPPASAARPA